MKLICGIIMIVLSFSLFANEGELIEDLITNDTYQKEMDANVDYVNKMMEEKKKKYLQLKEDFETREK